MINSTFYRPPSPSSASAWIRRIEHNPDFKFTAKLYRVFTHESGGGTQQDKTDFRKGLDPISHGGRLGALLIQFPWSFKNTQPERERLSRLLKQFSQYPLVVELRHASWNSPGVLDWFEEAGINLISQIQFARSKGLGSRVHSIGSTFRGISATGASLKSKGFGFFDLISERSDRVLAIHRLRQSGFPSSADILSQDGWPRYLASCQQGFDVARIDNGFPERVIYSSRRTSPALLWRPF